MPMRSGLMFGVWSHKWEGVGGVRVCRNITGSWWPPASWSRDTADAHWQFRQKRAWL